MRFCNVCDCTDAKNDCKTCKYKDECDYVWVTEIWKKNQKLLTPLNPGWVKPDFKNNHVVTVSGKYDFCVFNVPKKTETITINDICVDEAGRGQGLSKKLIYGLMEKYDRDIIAKCVKDSSAEDFWSHIGEKIAEEPGKQRPLSVYKVRNEKMSMRKQELF